MARMRGFLWLLAGLVIALLAGFVAFTTLSQFDSSESGPVASGPQVTVVVTTRSIAVRSELTSEDIIEIEMPVSMVPNGAIATLDDAIGKMTLVDLYPGEVVLAPRLVDPVITSGDGRIAVAMTEDEVLMAIPAVDVLSQVGVLKPGDQIDIHFSLAFPVERAAGGGDDAIDEEQQTFAILQNLTVASLVGGQTPEATTANAAAGQTTASEAATQAAPIEPTAVLLTVEPQDALVLKYMLDAGGVIDMVMRSPGVDRDFETVPVDLDYIINRYDIPLEIGR